CSCMASFINRFIFNFKFNYPFFLFLTPWRMFEAAGEKEEDEFAGRRRERCAATV
ncbi:hypothetical protein A2U01_0110662, partial [Trifolium medium]|nr:hypothetical protein [Trifolium medium]